MLRLPCAMVVLVAWLSVPALAQPPAAPPPAQSPPAPPAQPKGTTPPLAAKAATAVITLEQGGEIRLEFWPADAPNHVKNFLDLIAKNFYDGQRVHRVEPKFVVQFGDPQSKSLPMEHAKMGTGGPGYTIKAEFNQRPFERGVLGMARANDPDSAGSQVYIMLGPAPFLNGKYTAFGRVTSGMDVVDRIKVGDRIQSIKVVR